MKFGLWLLIAVVALLWFSHAKRQRLKQGKPPAATAAPNSAASEQMVACAECGLYIPRSDAVRAVDGSAVYCSQAHRRLHWPE